MKKYSRLILVSLIVILGMVIITASLPAQQQRPQQQQKTQGLPMLPDSTHIVQIVHEMTEVLKLNKEQVIKISELHFAHFSEAGKMMRKRHSDRENHRKEMDKLRKEFEASVKALLNKKQKETFEELMKRRRPPRGAIKR